jgi:serine protease Do
MKKNKLALNLALLSTGITGVLVGALVVNKPNMDQNISSFAAEKTQIQSASDKTYTSTTKTDIAEKLSKDFITISKDVTPAIVSIYSTKIIKQKPNYHEFMDDPYLKRFFGNPNNPHKKNLNPDEQEESGKEQGLGSGVIIDKQGIILTNNHVVEGADDINVTLSDKRKFKAKIIGTDPKTDVAVIKLEKAKDLPVARLGDSGKIEVGEWVLAIGNPLGLSSTVTSGIISAKGRADVGVADFEDFIQTDAAINPGNSGGALVNLQGEVIGINTAIASRTGGYMGIGFAIPSNMAKKVMNDLVNKGRVTRGFLGIQIQNITESIAKRLKIEDSSNGIVVGEVTPNSPAQKAGMQPYDVIIELNGNKVNDVSSFRNNIASNNPGETVKLGIIRDGKKITVNIKLAELDNKKITSEQQSEPNQNQEENLNLGFNVEPITKEILKELGINKKINGVVITSVNPSSGASEAGLNRGDIIQEMNRVKINSEADYNKVAKEIKSGDSVLLKILRNNQPLLLAFTYQ